MRLFFTYARAYTLQTKKDHLHIVMPLGWTMFGWLRPPTEHCHNLGAKLHTEIPTAMALQSPGPTTVRDTLHSRRQYYPGLSCNISCPFDCFGQNHTRVTSLPVAGYRSSKL
ncbi:hypothetical protein BDW75DRAFT_85995 [Aspergillus navahoensis]